MVKGANVTRNSNDSLSKSNKHIMSEKFLKEKAPMALQILKENIIIREWGSFGVSSDFVDQ